ncbi:hypothetical protein V6N11_017869 [Hibiscus sabdariffa]|uniref:Uncharacterized protein n=1 Tax=Hibiscus sabdariffa TaxID=183260 RepID=A0ABR2T6P2_9ROSI
MEVEDHLIDGRHEWECGKNVNASRERLKFAKVYVESPPRCSNCHVFGHTKKYCPIAISSSVLKPAQVWRLKKTVEFDLVHGESSSVVAPDVIKFAFVSVGNILEEVPAHVSGIGGTVAVDCCGEDKGFTAMCGVGCVAGIDDVDVDVVDGSVVRDDGTSCELSEALDGDFPPLQASAKKKGSGSPS